MRPKFVALVIGITALLIAGLFLLHQHHQSKDASAINVTVGQPLTSNLPADGAEKIGKASGLEKAIANDAQEMISGTQPTNRMSSSRALESGASTATLTHEEYVEKRVGELGDLGMSDDPASLRTILSEVRNAEPEIRKAAIEAAKQFGSADAIPQLEDALASADTLSDKQDLQEAIEFLKLPSFLAKRN